MGVGEVISVIAASGPGPVVADAMEGPDQDKPSGRNYQYSFGTDGSRFASFSLGGEQASIGFANLGAYFDPRVVVELSTGDACCSYLLRTCPSLVALILTFASSFSAELWITARDSTCL